MALSVRLCVCVSARNLRSLKSHDNKTWHVGPLSDLDVHGLFGILIYGRIAPQAHAFGVFPLYYQLKTQVAMSYGGFATKSITLLLKTARFQ